MTTAQKPDALPVVDDLRLLAASMRHSAGQWMVPGWDGHKVAGLLEKAQASLLAKEAECEALREALLKIARWELPATGKFWDEEKTRPTSYEAEYGSNGARAYMRTLALAAIDAARAAADQGGA